MARLLSEFPVSLLDDIVNGKCLPVVGAGFSRNAHVPAGKSMPDWQKLGSQIGSEVKGYDAPVPMDPIDAISAYEHEYKRSKLVERLGELLLLDEANPGRTHAAFCRCPFDLVVTTNLEFLLERAYDALGRKCLAIIEEDQLPTIIGKYDVTLLKLHGDLRHPKRLTMTEKDYDTFLNDHPLMATYLASLLITRTPLLIGYSLNDPDFRHVWRLVTERLGSLRRQAYVLTVGATTTEIARYDRRNVKVLNLPGKKEDYASIFADLFDEIREYWPRELPRHSTALEDRAEADFSLPADTMTRLCFFAIPVTSLSTYRSVVFPIAERFGFAPISPEDLVSPGDSAAAKAFAILSKAEAVVVDASYRWLLGEIRMLPRKIPVLVVGHEDSSAPPIDLSTWGYVRQPSRGYWHDDKFLSFIQEWFAEASSRVLPRLTEEPARLLGMGESRAAVISAIGTIEAALRERLETIDGHNGFRYGSFDFRSLVGRAIGFGLLTEHDAERILSWRRTRNRIVHMGAQVNRKQAEDIVQGTTQFLATFRDNAAQQTAAGRVVTE